MKIARKTLGIAKFERTCRLTDFCGKQKKAYKVPGTKEAGRYAMMLRMANSICIELRQRELSDV